jgi:hypothetical protein
MMKNRRNVLTMVLAAVVAIFTVSMATAATVSVNVPSSTFAIANLGNFTLVLKEGVPQAIVATGQKFTGMGVGTDINGMAGPGDVALTSNLNLVPGTMPLMFEHDGYVNFTIGADMLSLKYNGMATKTKDVAMLTKTLSSSGDFVVANGTGEFAALEGAKGTYTLTLVCHIVPGEHPMVGNPVEVTFSAMGM